MERSSDRAIGSLERSSDRAIKRSIDRAIERWSDRVIGRSSDRRRAVPRQPARRHPRTSVSAARARGTPATVSSPLARRARRLGTAARRAPSRAEIYPPAAASSPARAAAARRAASRRMLLVSMLVLRGVDGLWPGRGQCRAALLLRARRGAYAICRTTAAASVLQRQCYAATQDVPTCRIDVKFMIALMQQSSLSLQSQA